jgi:hypothetical protein
MLNCERTESSIVELIAQPVLVTVSSEDTDGHTLTTKVFGAFISQKIRFQILISN